MFSWLLSKPIKKEVKGHLHNLHNQLTHSFSKIKQDISHVHILLQNKGNKMLELEGKIDLLENKLVDLLQVPKPKQISEPTAEYYEGDVDKRKIMGLNLASLTFTQKLLLKNIYELKIKYNKDLISSKSLGKYVYPGRRYDSIRTTLSEYINILFESGLVKKERMGRRVIITLTKEGEEVSKEIIKKEKKKKQKIRVQDNI